jgi:ABC-type multidrug transport system fused ATPase/permease subunit
MKIKTNDIVGLIGESGSGKTTLINILLGFSTPTQGKFLVDNKNIYNNITNWQSLIGYTRQKSFLFNDTIEKNITLSLENLNIEENKKISAILKVCELEKFSVGKKNINLIGESNNKISGGQAQRIGIARALYNNPKLLILDEATSEVDKFTENKILNNILNYYNGHITIILTTHRIESIQKICNKIYKLEEAKIIRLK